MFNDHFIANFPENVTVKEFCKWASIKLTKLCVDYVGLLFLAHPEGKVLRWVTVVRIQRTSNYSKIMTKTF